MCSGNSFRSPIAEAFLGAMARDQGLNVTAESAGTLQGYRSIAPSALAAIGSDGLDMSHHQSRLLGRRAIRRSDLVLGMAREHVRETVALDPPAWQRSFTLKEFVRRGEAVGARPEGEPLGAWLEKVGAGRRREELLGSSTADDVADPMNGGDALCRAIADEVRDLVHRVLLLIEPGN